MLGATDYALDALNARPPPLVEVTCPLAAHASVKLQIKARDVLMRGGSGGRKQIT
jgi:hypothetical protein